MRPRVTDIEKFLREVDKSFPVPLSQKQDLGELALKFSRQATLCVVWNGDEICSMVAGYTENVINNMAYISVVATADSARGKGYASKLVEEFISISREKQIDAVHLYTDRKNNSAIKMYERIGFEEYVTENESRPDDLHLIYYLADKRG